MTTDQFMTAIVFSLLGVVALAVTIWFIRGNREIEADQKKRLEKYGREHMDGKVPTSGEMMRHSVMRLAESVRQNPQAANELMGLISRGFKALRSTDEIKAAVERKELLAKEAAIERTLEEARARGSQLSALSEQIIKLQQERDSVLAGVTDDMVKRQIREMYEAKIRALQHEAK